MSVLQGIPAAPGVAIGRAFVVNAESIPVTKRKISTRDVATEVVRFEDALIQTRREIVRIQKRIEEEMGSKHAEIFSAHLLVLEDRLLIEEVIERLKKEHVNVESIFSDVLGRYTRAFASVEDEYLRERVGDIMDVGRRILRCLVGQQKEPLSELKEEAIVVANDFSPSDTAQMHKRHVIGIVTAIGGRTSHTAIMAKSLAIPAVVGVGDVTMAVKHGDLLVLDGSTGRLEVNPDQATVRRYERVRTKLRVEGKGLQKLRDLPCETRDGHRVRLAANMELPSDIPSALAQGAEGIGLYRSEYFYMNRQDLPTEEEHFQAYREVLRRMAPHPVVLRTLDLGGDKYLSQLDVPKEMNPFLGWRAIRLSLAHPELFKVQLRAALRASATGSLKIMYPMISGVEELIQANRLLAEAKEELRRKGQAFNDQMPVGAMIEIPSAAMTPDLLAREVDFFSIGTNDLIQYALAIDRANEKVAYLYEPAHPAVLRLVKRIIEAGHERKIWVGMCGEMASEPLLTLLLLGFGLDEFSTSPAVIPAIKRVIRAARYEQARQMADHALGLGTGKDVEAFVAKELKALLPDL